MASMRSQNVKKLVDEKIKPVNIVHVLTTMASMRSPNLTTIDKKIKTHRKVK